MFQNTSPGTSGPYASIACAAGVPLSDQLLAHRIIFLGEITDETAMAAVSAMIWLDAQAPDKDISLYINSPGGSVTAGMAIYDTMHLVHCEVSTVCVGRAASMGAVLLAAGTKGKRFALPHSEIMIHQPLGGCSGQATDIKILADHILHTREMLNGVLANCTGKPTKIIERDTERDRYMAPAEAVAYGLIDSILMEEGRNEN